MITGDYLLTAIAIAKNVARWQGRGVVKPVTSWLNLIGIPFGGSKAAGSCRFGESFDHFEACMR
jgi:hypothetical protein